MSVREKLLSLKSGAVKPVTIGADTFYVRRLSIPERDAYESDNTTLSAKFEGKGKNQKVTQEAKQNLKDRRSRLLVKALGDETGKRLFEDSEIKLLADLDAVAGDILYTEAATYNHLDGRAIEEDSPEKNSNAELSDSSSA